MTAFGKVVLEQIQDFAFLASAESSSMKVKITTYKSVYIKGEKIIIYVHAKDMNGNAVGRALVQVAFAHNGKSYAMDRESTCADGTATHDKAIQEDELWGILYIRNGL